jgi:hypothetical protein
LFSQQIFVLDVYSDQAVETHPLICDPRQKKKCDNVSSPVVEQDPKTCDYQDDKRHPVAKAVFAGKNVEEFALKDGAAALTLVLTVVSPLAKDLLLCDRPGDRRHDNGKYDDPKYLPRDRHKKFGVPPLGG